MLYAIIGLLVVILDQGVKYWASFHVDLESTGNTFIPGIISLVNVHNDGAAFGFLAGSNARIPFIIITGVFIVAVIIALATKFISGRFARWCLVLVTAGGFSNCIDRVIYGYVQDMFKCELFNFPVFNVADIFISVFAILFALAVIFERGTVDDDDYEDDYDDYDDEYEDEEDDDYEDEEDERPARKGRRGLFARRKARDDDYEDDYDDEYEDEDEEPEPEPVKPARKTRQERAEEEFRQQSARRAAVEPAKPEPKKPAPAPKAEERKPAAKKPAQSEDPFAAWEQANARVAAESARQNAARGLPATSVPAAPAAKPAAAKPAPAPKPAAKKPVPAEEEFSLEDILAEFK